MIFFDLLRQQWLHAVRARGFYKKIVVGIFTVFMALYFSAILLLLGFTLGMAIKKSVPENELLLMLSGSVAYCILLGLSVRFLFQQLGTINLQTYQILPIKRLSLINYIVLKSLFNPVNYFMMIFFIPFTFVVFDGYEAIKIICVFVEIIWFNTLTAIFLKRKFGSSLLGIIGVIVVLGLIFAMEYFKIFSLFELSKHVFGFISHSWGLIVIFMLVVAAYALNRLFFAQNYYAESFERKSKKLFGSNVGLSFFDRFGITGEIMSLELKLMLRHKRTRSVLFLSLICLLYGLLFYLNPAYKESNTFFFFAAFCMIGLASTTMGQSVIGVDSSCFDGLMTENMPVRNYFIANLRLMQMLCVISFVLSSPYFFIGEKVIVNHIAALLFSIGFVPLFLLYFATYNTKRIDLKNGTAFNLQGVSLKNFIVIIPVMFVPIILIAVMGLFFKYYVSLILLSVLGCLGLVFQKQLIDMCVKQFYERKYKICEGFRESE